jgi:hypothetical protein
VNTDVKSFVVTLQKLSQPLVQDGSLTAAFNAETLNAMKAQNAAECRLCEMIEILTAHLTKKIMQSVK